MELEKRPNTAIERAVLEQEQEQVTAVEEQKRRLWPRAAAVGLIAGLAAVAFRAALLAGDGWRDRLIEWSHGLGWYGAVFPALLGALGGGIGVLLVLALAPETAGSGIPHLRAVLLGLRPMRWKRVIPVKFVAGVSAIGGGLALGREGPTVQMGGAIGEFIARWSSASQKERATLLAAGAGAGLAAAFNAPLAGVIFVQEEIERNLSPVAFSAIFVACATGDLVTRFLVGPSPAFHVPAIAAPEPRFIPYFLVLGAVVGVIGVLMNRCLLRTMDLFERIRWPFLGASGALVGAAIGLLGYFRPDVIGGGHHLAERTLHGNVLLWAIPGYFLLRFGLTMVSYGTGAAGGIFAPLLVLGAQAGLAVGLLSRDYLGAGGASPSAFAVVGMAALFTASIRAPLTGIVLIAELTGGYQLMLPLLAATAAAYGVAEWMHEKPIYESLMERSVSRG